MAESNRHDAATRYTGWERILVYMDRVEAGIVSWLAGYSVPFLRGGLGMVFLWFGALKFIPSASPAQGLVIRTTEVLTMGMIPPEVSLLLVAILECAIGIGFLTGKYMRTTLMLMAFQMVGALSPLVLVPEAIFTVGLYAPTLEGQYIIKNVVLIGAALMLGATVRGGRIVAEPEEA